MTAAATNDGQGHGDDQPVLSELRDHAAELADGLPGDLRRIRVRSGDADIEVEWQASDRPGQPGPAAGTGEAQAVAPGEASAGADDSADDSGAGHDHVTSPVVGTFYRAPEPGAEPFVTVGDHIEEGQVVGIVEAMKLMNPVTAGVGGEVVEILAENAQPVEFGQPLIAVQPAT
jgi:acetyl-CoA carboxylase biotin carboxyl carrier protein